MKAHWKLPYRFVKLFICEIISHASSQCHCCSNSPSELGLDKLCFYFCLLFYSLMLSSHAHYAFEVNLLFSKNFWYTDIFYVWACSERRPTHDYNIFTQRRVRGYSLPYSGKFSNGANFRIIISNACSVFENKNCENLKEQAQRELLT